MRSMRICLMVEGQENVTWDRWVALARACEEHGFDAMFRSDHYSSLKGRDTEGSLDAWATLSALAPITERLRLGTMVSPVAFRAPAVLAKSVVTADHVSGGRVELGMGAGWHEGEHRNWGFPSPPVGERVGMLEEQVQIVHRLMSKDEPRVSFEGRYYRLEDCPALPKPGQDPHVPLILGGGGGPRVSRLAALWADEYNTAFKTPDECREIRRRLDAACEEVGRDPSTLPMSLMTGFAIGATPARAAERATMAGDLRGLPAGDDPIEALGDAYVAGTPDRVLDKLARFADAGITRVMLQHLMQDDLESVALVGTDVIPDAAAL